MSEYEQTVDMGDPEYQPQTPQRIDMGHPERYVEMSQAYAPPRLPMEESDIAMPTATDMPEAEPRIIVAAPRRVPKRTVESAQEPRHAGGRPPKDDRTPAQVAAAERKAEYRERKRKAS